MKCTEDSIDVLIPYYLRVHVACLVTRKLRDAKASVRLKVLVFGTWSLSVLSLTFVTQSIELVHVERAIGRHLWTSQFKIRGVMEVKYLATVGNAGSPDALYKKDTCKPPLSCSPPQEKPPCCEIWLCGPLPA